jgi:hypothetical protein
MAKLTLPETVTSDVELPAKATPGTEFGLALDACATVGAVT